MKNSESPNKQFALPTHARVVARSTHRQDRRVHRSSAAKLCGTETVFAQVQKSAWHKGFLHPICLIGGVSAHRNRIRALR
jgi:hypothetical protein